MGNPQRPPGGADGGWEQYHPDRDRGRPEDEGPVPVAERLPRDLPPVELRTSGAGRAVLLMVVLVVGGALVTIAVTFLSILDAGEELLDMPGVEVPDHSLPDDAPPDVLSAPGYREMLAALRAERGRTVVFDATLYPEYASLEVPEDGTTRRSRRLHWDGDLRDVDSLGSASFGRVDLADVDPRLLERLSRQARRLVEDPTSWYVIVRGAPSTSDDGVRIMAYASNEYREGGYLAADLSGKVIRRSSW